MASFSRGDVVLVRYPFSDLSAAKVRPAVVVGQQQDSQDLIIVPLTSRTQDLRAGEFVLQNWSGAGLNVPSAVKRGIYTISANLVLRHAGRLREEDNRTLDASLRAWLGLGQ